ncbi:MAG TPA: hypothetical protein VN428_14575 [Bryobacteraceae bacterium]|nr:hypothetical protein [Bryobacteraceae bacterium]
MTRIWREKLGRRDDADRDFDIDFWQQLGPARIVEAAWDLVVTAASAKGIDESQLRLQRSVEKLKRIRRPVSGHRRTR